MKKIIYICIILVMMLFLWSCVKEYIDSYSDGEDKNAYLTIAQAQEFFERQITKVASRAGGDKRPRGLTPGDFTPQWDRAKTSQNDKVASVDIPITSQYRYRAIRSEFKNGKAKAYTVEITQKLIVVKSKDKEQMSQYILTLIPDREYYQKNKREISDKFLNSGDNGGFSGVIMYLIHGLNIPIRVDKYIDGIKIAGVFLLDNSKEKIAGNIEKAKVLIGCIKLWRSAQSVISRSWGEDDDWWGEDEDLNLWDDLMDRGNGTFGDNTYHYWYESGDDGSSGYWLDTNGNGKPDTYIPLTDPYPDDGTSDSNWSAGGFPPDDNWPPDEPPGVEPPIIDGGGQPGYPDPSQPPNNPQSPQIKPDKKVSYNALSYKNTGGYIKGSCDCMCMTQKIMKQILGNNANIGSNATKMQLYLENSSGLYKAGDANAVFNTLNSHIDGYRSIIAGVDHSPNQKINEGATDHFVVITGRGYDSDRGQYYYNYIETARGGDRGSDALSDSNRLYYDENVGIFKTDDGAAYGHRTYTITQIRPNN